MPVSDNLDDVRRYFDGLIDSIDFTRPGRDGALGDDLIGLVHEGISDRNRDETDPEGNAWPANRGRYGIKKRADGIPVGVGYYKAKGSPDWNPGGEMTSLVQIQGEIVVQPLSVVSTYGVNNFARRKGSWFTRGSNGPGEGEVSGAANQPPRPFYAISDNDAEAVVRRAGEFLDEILEG